ncbi:MAG: glycosyltransferase 87 family protein [Bacteroidota bacterium]
MNFLKIHKIPLLFALLSAILYWVFAYNLIRSDFGKLISLYGALFVFAYQLIKMYGWNFWLLAGFGIGFRLIFLPAIPNLSQDFYRFLWDGRLVIQGINPYSFTPEQFLNDLPPKILLSHWTLETWNAISLSQGQELYAGMGELNGSHYSNYPPVNQLCFAIASLFTGKSILGSAIVLRVLIILADIGILYFGKKLLEGLKLPIQNIFWYFLNPFIIIELTGNLHFEGVMLFFVVGSFYLLWKGKWFWAAILFGLSISVKLIPLLLLPLFFKYLVKRDKIGGGMLELSKFYLVTLFTVFVTFAPFLSPEFVSNFSDSIALWFQNFEFNASIYYIIRWIGFQTIGWNIIADVGKILPLVVTLLILLLTFFRRNNTLPQLITGMLFAISAYFLLSTTVHPWYIATPLILTVFTNYRFPVVWSLMVMFSYSAYGADGFSENLWLVTLEYMVVIGFASWELSKRSIALKHAK